LLVGGYAVGQYGYPRTTADMDVWIERTPANAARIVKALIAFGFDVPELSADLFMEDGKIVRMGRPPLRLEILNKLSGVSFSECYPVRNRTRIDGIKVDMIGLADLKRNKAAAGRAKDLDDLEHLHS
jgi:hypothetical protein